MIDRLPELAKFADTRKIKPGESFDALLATNTQPICLFTSQNGQQAAHEYREIIGKKPSNFDIIVVNDPIAEAISIQTPGVIPLVMYEATNPDLFKRMFADGPKLGQLLMGHLYKPEPNHESPMVLTIGIANQGLDILSSLPMLDNPTLSQQMEHKRKEILGPDILTNQEFRGILRSPSVQLVIAHALGPVGTNISQAMKQYIQALEIEEKTNLIVHPVGVEPLAYAEMAAAQIQNGVVPIHMECAVFYDLLKLFNDRTQEVVFADHHYMELDAMQLASIEPVEQLAIKGKLRIATHPSPRPLINPWVETDKAEWIKATSNSAAALMVLDGQADACVTTASGLKQAPQLVSRHIFGSPYMFFTIATPLNQERLRSLNK